jgi:RNA polymerase sigma-70 factor (ECF subfamily)
MSLTPESTWELSMPSVAVRRPLQPGKSFRHALLIEMSVCGTCSPSIQWLTLVGRELRRTLECLLGPDAPLAELHEVAQFDALGAWPPPREQPLSVWLRCIASRVALSHLKAEASNEHTSEARPGGVGEVLSHLYARLRAMPPNEQLAFALVERNGSSVSEAAAVLRVPTATILRRVARVRRQLLFAARRDPLLLRYLCIARRLQAMSRWPASVPSSLAAE